MKNQNDFINEMDDGYIDIESCFDPVFEPPAELLEEWSRRYEGPEPTLENTSFYVVGPDGHEVFLLRESLHQNLRAFCGWRQADGRAGGGRRPATMRAGTAAPRPF